MGKNCFKFVFIPCQLTDSIEEWELDQPKGKEVECLLDRLKLHFSSGQSAELSEKAKEQQRQAFLSQLPEESRKNVTKELLDTATGLQLVESIALLPNTARNGFVAVNMYVDDKGSIRGLPFNTRASEIAKCCGHPIEVRGDAFLARVMDNEDDFKRYDFTLDEMSSEAAWVHNARLYYEQKAKEEPAAEVLARIRSNASNPSEVVDLTPAESEKQEGNVAFKAGRYEEAVQHYSKAIEHDPQMCIAFNNRAMAYLKLNKYVEGEADASKALELEPRNVKAMLRRGVARESLGNFSAARMDYQGVVEMEPQNHVAKEKLQSLPA